MSLTENNWKLGQPQLRAEVFQQTVWHSCRIVNFLEPQGAVPQVLNLHRGVRFIAWRLGHPSLGECQRSLRHFWSRWMRVGFGPASGPT